jgi:hypothetical protein
MKIKLHRPKQGVWTTALVLLLVGVVAPYLPIVSGFAYVLVLLSAALLLLGTWLF